MLEPFIGQICMFGFNFAPRSWALCEGQVIAIAQNQALFSLIGTIYGGDGRTSFALPNLMGRSPVGMGNGPGLSPRRIGQLGGSNSFNLLTSNLPPHNHSVVVKVANQDGSHHASFKGVLGKKALDVTKTATNAVEIYVPLTSATFSEGNTLGGVECGYTGGGQSVYHQGPYLTINFCIAMDGIFPSRN